MSNNTLQPEKDYLAEMIISLIAESSDNNLQDIHPDAYLARELNITRHDYVRLIKLIEKTYNDQIIDDSIAPVSLDPLLEDTEMEEIETVADVIDAVSNEIELG